jgi:hypothetical protein
MSGKGAEMLNQMITCTSRGTERNTQMYTPAVLRISANFDIRMSASTAPRQIPITIASTVSWSVAPSPFSSALEKKYRPITSQPNRSSVNNS